MVDMPGWYLYIHTGKYISYSTYLLDRWCTPLSCFWFPFPFFMIFTLLYNISSFLSRNPLSRDRLRLVHGKKPSSQDSTTKLLLVTHFLASMADKYY
jgi:hypothetical protein